MLLTPQDVELFFKLHRGLMFFVNQRLKVIPDDVASPDEFSSLSPQTRLKVRDAFLGHTDLIQAFVEENPARLSDDELDIVRSWQHLVHGKFYVFRELKKYTVFLSTDRQPPMCGSELGANMPQKWLEELQEKVATCWQWHSPALQIGFRYAKPDQADDFWEIWAYPAVQEIVGGKEDGETVWSGFNFNVLEFLKDFEPEVVAISTRQHIHPSELTFEGKFRGKGVFLHLCLEPPEDAEATEIVDLRGDGGPVVRDKE